MIFHKKFVFILFLLPVFSISQNISKDNIDSLRQNFLTSEITDYQQSLERGMDIYKYQKLQKNDCEAIRLVPRISLCWERIGKLDSSLQIILRNEEKSLECNPELYLKLKILQTSIYIEMASYEQVNTIVTNTIKKLKDDLPDSSFNDIRIQQAIALVYLGNISEAKAIFRAYYKNGLLHNDTIQQIDALSNLGALAGYTENLDSAEYYLSRALGICADINCKNQIELLQNLATLASYKEDYKLSKFYLDSCISLAIKSKNTRSEAALYRELAVTLKGLGDCETALDRMFDHSDLKDSVLNREIVDAIAKYQEQFESEKKTRKIKELEVERLDSELRENKLRQTRNLFLISGIGILLLAGGLWSRLRYINKTKSIIEKEKERSDNLLLNILPTEVAEELKIHGKADAKDFEMVSILFTDFAGFTETSAKLNASELVEEINECFETFDNILEKYGIEKIKTIGDAYMAAGGIPIPSDSSVKKTILAAIEMQEFISKRKIQKDKIDKPGFEMRVGIHTGPVVAGIVGVKKFQYDLWGDTVNTASRMENLSEIGKINISQATYELIKNLPDFEFESRGMIEVKGKGKLKMYFVSRKV